MYSLPGGFASKLSNKFRLSKHFLNCSVNIFSYLKLNRLPKTRFNFMNNIWSVMDLHIFTFFATFSLQWILVRNLQRLSDYSKKSFRNYPSDFIWNTFRDSKISPKILLTILLNILPAKNILGNFFRICPSSSRALHRYYLQLFAQELLGKFQHTLELPCDIFPLIIQPSFPVVALRGLLNFFQENSQSLILEFLQKKVQGFVFPRNPTWILRHVIQGNSKDFLQKISEGLFEKIY